MMRNYSPPRIAALLATLLAIPAAAQNADAPRGDGVPTVATPSSILQPALDSVRQTLTMVRPEKWKASGPVTQETQANLTSIQTDLQTTLPPLLTVADQNPGSLAQVLPVFRNASALYDVLLRVTEVSLLTAPASQSSALQHALSTLEASRRDLGDSLQSSALAENQKVHDLQSQLRTAQSASAPVAAACPPPAAPVAPAKRRKHRPKPAAAPAAAPPAAAPASPPISPGK